MHPVVLATVILSKYAAFNIKEVEQFVGGLVFGFVQEDDLTKIQTCLKDAQTVDEEMTQAIADIMKKDLQDIVKGIEEMATVVGQLTGDLNDCKGMETDIARIEKWAAIFKNPKELIQVLFTNVIKNIKNIETDISSITTDVAADNFWKVGTDAADLMVQAVGPVPAAADIETIEVTQW